MVSDNILTGSQGSQLFAIQQTSWALDLAQSRIASGNRVNSPLDNPQSYFTSFSLQSDAAQLNRVLDNIGQGVRTIQIAEFSSNTLGNLIDTARNTAQDARNNLQNDAQDLGAKILDDTPVIYYRFDETSGATAVNLGSAGATLNGTINGGADLNQGSLTFSLDNNSISLNGANGYVTIPNNNLVNTNPGGYAQRTVEVTFKADNLTGRQVIFEEGGTGNSAAIYLDNENLYFVARDAGDFGPFNISIEVEANRTYQASFVLDSDAGTFTGYLDGEKVGEGAINRPLSRHGGAVAIGRNSGGTFFHDGANSGNGEYFQGQISDFALYNSALTQEDLRERFDITQLAQAEQYKQNVQNIINQVDSLIEDSGYRGVNLLNGDNFKIELNASGSSNLLTQGEDLTSSGLGFSGFDFTNFEGIDDALLSIDNANDKIERFSSGLSNDLSLIQNKQDFLSKTANTYKAGAEDLTRADLDEEGAKILSLQAKQEIQQETLSLSTQGSSIADFLSRNPLLNP